MNLYDKNGATSLILLERTMTQEHKSIRATLILTRDTAGQSNQNKCSNWFFPSISFSFFVALSPSVKITQFFQISKAKYKKTHKIPWVYDGWLIRIV